MSKTTHTASSREPGSWMENVPPEERAAAMSEAAPPPKDFPQGGPGEAHRRETSGRIAQPPGFTRWQLSLLYRMAVRRAGAAAMNPLLHRVGGRAGGAPPSGQVHQPPQFTAMGHPQVRGARHLTSLSPTSKHNKSQQPPRRRRRADSLPARRPGDDGGPAANPVHHLPSGRANQPLDAPRGRARAPPSAATCIAGRKTRGRFAAPC